MSPKRRTKPKSLPRSPRRDTARGHLTEMQERFCHHFVESGKPTASARWAGYSHTHAKVEASELLRNPKVIKRLKELGDFVENELGVTDEKLVREAALRAFADPTEVMRIEAGKLEIRNTSELTPGARLLLAEASETMTKEGGTLRVKLVDQFKYLELLMRVKGMLKADNPFGSFRPDPTKPLVAVPIYMPAQLEA